MDFLALQTEVFRGLEENSADPDFYSLDDVKDAINEGYECIAEETLFHEAVQTIPFVAGQLYYDLWNGLGADLLALFRIFNTATGRWMDQENLRSLDNERRSWEGASGSPERWVWRALWWMGLYPRSSSSTGGMTIRYSAIPNRLSDDLDVPLFPYEFHTALMDYALYDLLIQEGEHKKAMRFWNSYVALSKSLKSYVQHQMHHDRVRYMGEVHG